jgi:hypothetical protein
MNKYIVRYSLYSKSIYPFNSEYRYWISVSFLYKNKNMIKKSRRVLSNTGVTTSYLTTMVPRNVSKLCANRVSSPMYNILFLCDYILVVFIFLIEKLFLYNECHCHITKAVSCNCTAYLQEFILLLPNNSARCCTIGDGFLE